MIALIVSTHSRLKAADRAEFERKAIYAVSTHSRLKAAGIEVFDADRFYNLRRFNTQPPEGGCRFCHRPFFQSFWFQHTAA